MDNIILVQPLIKLQSHLMFLFIIAPIWKLIIACKFSCHEESRYKTTPVTQLQKQHSNKPTIARATTEITLNYLVHT